MKIENMMKSVKKIKMSDEIKTRIKENCQNEDDENQHFSSEPIFRSKECIKNEYSINAFRTKKISIIKYFFPVLQRYFLL